MASLLAVSDLHVAYPENREIVAQLKPETGEDWLVIAGDIGETVDDVEWVLGVLSPRFAKVVWVPGNHELWTLKDDPVQLRGEDRYRHLVEVCRRFDVLTPEDEYPAWHRAAGPVVIAPLFLLYDYTFRINSTATKAESLQKAHDAGVVCTDELFLYPDPYPSREAWCAARVASTSSRLVSLGGAKTVLINHWPLVREPTRVLRRPEFAQWCGTELTANWHRQFNAEVVVYGHLHIPRTTVYDGVRFEEVSVGYPREWRSQSYRRGGWLRRILD
ncbi:MAG TPA: metallophosphoesterase [Mycobacterium sp.]